MILQIQPNEASCLATSVAMVLEMPVKKVFDWLGHDGTEIIWPHLPPPKKYRGFHLQEILKVCLQHNHIICPIYREPYLLSQCDELPYQYSDDDFFNQQLKKHSGILCGTVKKSNKKHAVAWEHKDKIIFDPAGSMYKLTDFDPEIFVQINRIEKTGLDTRKNK